MPVEITDLDEGRGNLVIGRGVVTGEEFVNALRSHFSQDEDKFRNYKYSLTDHSAVTAIIDVSVGDVRTIAQLCRQASRVNPDAVVAVVADRNVLFGLTRMWEMLQDGSGWTVKAFRTRDAAEAWIRETVRETFGIEHLAIR